MREIEVIINKPEDDDWVPYKETLATGGEEYLKWNAGIKIYYIGEYKSKYHEGIRYYWTDNLLYTYASTDNVYDSLEECKEAVWKEYLNTIKAKPIKEIT